jgi:stage V sporulation protein G
MEITEVRIKLMEDSDDRLQAFCSITFDNAFVVRDLKIIDGTNGPFVAMPSRKLTSHCHQCGSKNHLKAAYCNQCGARQRDDRLMRDAEGRAKLYADIAHPINSSCREMIQTRVIAEFRTELERAQQPGYVSKYDDDYDDDIDPSLIPQEERRAAPVTSPVASPASPTVHAQPAQPQPPPPHIVPSPAQPARSNPAGSASSGETMGGPHFAGPSPQSQQTREAVADTKEPAKGSKPRGDFGAGVF